MSKNKLIIAAAGSGKTTHIVNEALKLSDKNILITTFTEINELGIRSKFIKINKYIPSNITIQTWYTFLLQYGVKPYQSELDKVLHDVEIKGMLLVNQKSGMKYKGKNGPVYYKEETEFMKHYFTSGKKIYSDKVSKFVIKVNKISNGLVVDRLSRIFDCIYIDEAQDLAGYDLELLKALFASKIICNLVGDPRQTTYLTHNEAKYKKYQDGKLKDFINNELGKKINCKIDENTLNVSHRNNQIICDYSSRLYPEFQKILSCNCKSCQNTHIEHIGVFLVEKKDKKKYLNKYNAVQLRWNTKTDVVENYLSMNLGESKGLTFDRVLIYPTAEMKKWLKDNTHNLKSSTRAKLYVGITRAKLSVCFVYDFNDSEEFNGLEKYNG